MNHPEKTLLESEEDYLKWIDYSIREKNYDVAETDSPEKYPCVAILMVDDKDFGMSSSGMAYSTFVYQEDFKTFNNESI